MADTHRHPVNGRPATGLYQPEYEHDACGVAFVADLTGRRSHDIVQRALTALIRLEHRGARGAEVETGDGAGLLLQVPDGFYREVVPFELPESGGYAVGNAFLPTDEVERYAAITEIERIAAEEGLRVLGWRELPIDPDGATLGPTSRRVMPVLRQLFVAAQDPGVTGIALDRLAFCLRKRAEHGTRAYFPSLSARTIVYKGMLTEQQLVKFYPDVTDERVTSSLAMVHSRFSTNTFPSWPLAHPYRMICHNGEINTLRGNRNWMKAREALLRTEHFNRPRRLNDEQGPGDLERLSPIVTPEASDSATFDEVLELLHLGGRSLPHAVLMMIPEAWENHDEMDPARRAFYEFHSALMEPWDGPALIAFTDGTVIGAVLDRNGLRPGRYWVTEDGLVVLASEVGVLDVEQSAVVRKGRLEPGRMFLVDTAAGRIVDDAEIKAELAAEHPYADWLHAGTVPLAELPDREREVPSHASLVRRQQAFGYTEEELGVLLRPMATTGAEPIGSMGNDAPLAPFSARPRQLFDYFTQLFAQVTNPPLDAIREELVTSLGSQLGSEQNLLAAGAPSCRKLTLPFPVLDNDELAKIVHVNDDGDLPGFQAVTVRGLFDVRGGADAMLARLDDIRAEVSQAITEGARIIVLSNRGAGRDPRPDPVPAAHRRGAPPPGAGAHPHQGRAGRRGRRRPRGAPHLAAGRLRRRRGQPVPGDGHRRRPGGQGRHSGRRREDGHPQPDQGAGQGVAQDDVQDGRLDGGVLHRRADLRGDRARAGRDRLLLRGHHVPARRGRLRRAGRGGARATTGWPSHPTTCDRTTARWTSVASTSGGARASCTCSTRRPFSSCSTPPAAGSTRSSSSTPTRWTSSASG